MFGVIGTRPLVAALVTASLLVCAYQTAAAEPTVLRRVEEAEINGKRAKVTLYTMPSETAKRLAELQASRYVDGFYRSRGADKWYMDLADMEAARRDMQYAEDKSEMEAEIQARSGDGALAAIYTQLADFGRNTSRSFDNTVGILSGAINHWDLFRRGLGDVMTAAYKASRTGTANLKDPQARYEFWKEQGIYEKYTPGEREFLNRVVMPAAMTIYNAGGIASSFVTGGAIASGAAFCLTAAGLTIGAPVVAGVVVGTVLTGAWFNLTNRKRSQVETAGAEVVGTDARPTGLFQNAWLALKGALWAGSGASSFLGGGALIAGEGLAAGAIAGGSLLGAGVAGAIGMEATSNMAVTLTNVWGIPETYDVVYGEPEPRKDPPELHQGKEINFNLHWRLSK